jgi:dihydroxyacetone kinase phosphotransfer subunit
VKGIVIISHANEIVVGLAKLLHEVAHDVPITMAGGMDDGSIGTTFDAIQQAMDTNPADEIYAFYDLGSAKLNMEMVMELSSKTITLFDVPLIEGAYVAAALLQTGVDEAVILENLAPLQIK